MEEEEKDLEPNRLPELEPKRLEPEETLRGRKRERRGGREVVVVVRKEEVDARDGRRERERKRDLDRPLLLSFCRTFLVLPVLLLLLLEMACLRVLTLLTESCEL